MRYRLIALVLAAFASTARADPLFTYVVNGEPPAPLVSMNADVTTAYAPFFLFVDGSDVNSMGRSGIIDLNFAPVSGYAITGYTLAFTGVSTPVHYPGDVSMIEVAGAGFDFVTSDPNSSFAFVGSDLPVLNLFINLMVTPDFCLPGFPTCGSDGQGTYHEMASLEIDSITVTPNIVALPVPEPSEISLMGLGIVALYWQRRRRVHKWADRRVD